MIDPVLSYSTYLGGNNDEQAYGIAVGGSGNAYVTGATQSTNFPTTVGAFQTSLAGSNFDVFVTKMNATGTALVYSTYLGGNGYDQGASVAVDGSGNAYVTGDTDSTNFPTTAGAFQGSDSGPNYNTAFVAKLNANGTDLDYSTFLGGGGGDYGNGIAVDGSGNAYVTGLTQSTNFPTTTGAFQTSLANASGTDDAFVTKLNAGGTALLYSTYLGGGSSDLARGIAVDGSGNAYVTGVTDSASFPTTAGAFQTSLSGSSDAFVTELNTGGTSELNFLNHRAVSFDW